MSPSYVCGERRGAPHARARLAARNTQAHDVCVNGLPKTGPLPCGGAASFCCFCFWLLDSLRDNRFSDFLEPTTMRGRGLFYITDPSASTKTHLIELGFLPLLAPRLPS